MFCRRLLLEYFPDLGIPELLSVDNLRLQLKLLVSSWKPGKISIACGPQLGLQERFRLGI